VEELLRITNQAFNRAKAAFDKESNAIASLCLNNGVGITSLEAFSLLVLKAKLENKDFKNHLVAAIALADRLDKD
jgi:nucleoside phosphorylase